MLRGGLILFREAGMVGEGYKEPKEAAIAGVRHDLEVSLTRLKLAGVSASEALGVVDGAMKGEYGQTTAEVGSAASARAAVGSGQWTSGASMGSGTGRKVY